MQGMETIVLDVTEVVKNWIMFLDSLLGDFSEEEAFRLYNLKDDTLFFDHMSEDNKYIVMEYLHDFYITPLDNHLESMGYEIARVMASNTHKDPVGRLVINLVMKAHPIPPSEEFDKNEH